MRVLLLALLLAFSYEEVMKAHFHMDMLSLHYSFDGWGYAEATSKGVIINKDITGTFNGTFTDDKGVNHTMQGTVTVQDPPLSHLDKIMAKGTYSNSPADISYEGIFAVSVWDVVKPRIPFKGKLKFSNGKEGDARGLLDKPKLLEVKLAQ